jgi:hypothetical protein
MNVALLQECGGIEDGEHPRSDQESGEGHDQPKLAIAFFKLQELLANPRQHPFGLLVHHTPNPNIFGLGQFSRF